MSGSGHSQERSEYLRNLRQSRRFVDKPVPLAIIDELLDVARETGLDEERAAWQFQVVDDVVTRNALSEAGSLTAFLANVAAAIVLVIEGDVLPSRSSLEALAAERVMRAAGRHGLASGTGWFGTDEAREAAGSILGVRSGWRAVWAVGVGYVDESGAEPESSLRRVRQTLDRLAPQRRPAERPGDEPNALD